MNDTTSISLLDRVLNSADSASWDQLTKLYVPLMRRWSKRYHVQAADLDDVIQDVLAVLMQELPQFEHNHHPGAFRKWLRGILIHRLQQLWRSKKYEPQPKGTSSFLEMLQQLEDDGSEITQMWNAEHDRHVLSQLMALVKPRFERKTWEAFRRQIFGSQKAIAIAAELNMSVSSVYVARNRVLSELRLEADGLIDSIDE